MFIIFALSLTGIAYAVPVSDSNAADLLSNCLLEGDNKTASANGGKDAACCSKSLGYCVICRQGQTCTKVSYRLSPLNGENTLTRPGNAVIAPAPKPPSLRDQVKPAQSATTAPAKIVNPEKAPTVKPIKQYQQIKAPASADKAMSK
ncbi:MAG: hypothetical protein COA63_009030 [Methylophaga sp.]|nr:hypothetical protein [Methylophaga sp.]